MKVIQLFLCCWCCLPLLGVEPLQNEESVFIYCDSDYKSVFKDIRSTYKDALKARDVSWKVKYGRDENYIELAEEVEKKLLRADADRYILALGSSICWDKKKDQAIDYDKEACEQAILGIVQALKEKGKLVHICTPHQVLAGKNEAANAAITDYSERIKKIAEGADIVCFDIYEAFAQKNGSITDQERSKGITTKDGYKLNDEGMYIFTTIVSQGLALSSTSLMRDLRGGDVIGLAAPITSTLLGDFSLQVKEHYKDMGILAPRAVGFFFGSDLFTGRMRNLEKMKTNRVTVLFIYPGQTILGDKSNLKSLDDGRFKAQFKERLMWIRETLPQCAIFVFTPLVWREDNATNTVVPGGENFLICQKWAQQTREVAEGLGLPVVDLQKRCLDFIEKNGAAAAEFAGKKAKTGNFNDVEIGGREIMLKALAQTIGFDAYKED